ncbi:transglutaminase-like domain-containing protein [Candidatus Bathyarchaeota archaeon]|nr:transglutaminase-like domain-containing protein [Candidatus Bathyarchaeota archaeon]
MNLPDQASIKKYTEVSVRLADPSLLLELKKSFERTYDLAELLVWLHGRMAWSDGDMVRHNDPLEIIAYGKGRCGEFSILFTALCLAHGYRARLILDMSDHVWTEVWDMKRNRWMHIDPSEKMIDDPLMYERDWKKSLKEIYAFENGLIENVTERYKIARPCVSQKG